MIKDKISYLERLIATQKKLIKSIKRTIYYIEKVTNQRNLIMRRKSFSENDISLNVLRNKLDSSIDILNDFIQIKTQAKTYKNNFEEFMIEFNKLFGIMERFVHQEPLYINME